MLRLVMFLQHESYSCLTSAHLQMQWTDRFTLNYDLPESV